MMSWTRRFTQAPAMPAARPVFLDLWRIRLPLTGVVSILHRIGGLLLVLALPPAALLFQQALSGPAGFAAVSALLATWPARLLLTVLLWAVLHHLFAGIRQLLLDLGIGVERTAARRGARRVLIAAVAGLAVLAPVMLLRGLPA